MTTVVPSDYVWHSFYAVINALPRVWPYRHLVIEDFLHPALFEQVRGLDLARLVDQRNPDTTSSEAKRYYLTFGDGDLSAAEDSPPLMALWATLSNAKLSDLLRVKFADEIRKRHGDAAMMVAQGIEVIEDRTGYALLPHVDTVQKLVTTLVYLADPGADEALGTAIYAVDRPDLMPTARRDNSRLPREAFALVRTVPYRPNTALIFAPGDETFHGVEPVAPGAARRLLQFQINKAKTG